MLPGSPINPIRGAIHCPRISTAPISLRILTTIIIGIIIR
jgi:hypothetical protein